MTTQSFSAVAPTMAVGRATNAEEGQVDTVELLRDPIFG
jgi:hypothetical protein